MALAPWRNNKKTSSTSNKQQHQQKQEQEQQQNHKINNKNSAKTMRMYQVCTAVDQAASCKALSKQPQKTVQQQR